MVSSLGTAGAARIAVRGRVGDRADTKRTEVACFTPGTLITTARGETPVEELRVGDRVTTRDNGFQEICWTGRKTVSGVPLLFDNQLHPVRIRAGALGDGLPERDMLVSPGHRVLIEGGSPAVAGNEIEAFVTAKHLVGTRGVEQVAVTQVSYLHFMCDRHEVVLSDGAWTESFRPGDRALQGVGAAATEEIFELFPELRQAGGRDRFPAARPTLNGRNTGAGVPDRTRRFGR